MHAEKAGTKHTANRRNVLLQKGTLAADLSPPLHMEKVVRFDEKKPVLLMESSEMRL